MNLLHWYLDSYKGWKRFQQLPPAAKALGKWPSETFNKYPPSSTFGGKTVLNLGCGKTVYTAKNVINADVVPGPGINLVLTSNEIPLPDNSVDFIIANHVIEHIPNWFETFKELARILKLGGRLEVWIPPVSSDSAFTYRDHLNRIGLLSFSGCKPLTRTGANALAEEEFKSLGHVAKLSIIKTASRPIVRWWTVLAWPSLLSWMSAHLRNVISEELFVFEKVEP